MKKKVKPGPKQTLDHRLLYGGIFLLAFLLYGNTLNHGLVLDDPIFITHHSSVQKGFAGIGEIFSQGSTYAFNQVGGQQPYRPVTLLTFAIGKSLYNNAPFVEHLINLLLYALIGIWLFKSLQYWLPKYGLYPLLACVALFMVHPVHTEVVANIKSRDEILCLLFALMSLVYAHRSLGEKGKKSFYLSLAFFALSIFSKENGITILAVIPLSQYFFSGAPLKKIGLQSLPYLGIAAVFMLIRSLVIETPAEVAAGNIVNNVLYASANWGEQTATTTAIMGHYLKLLLLPFPLSWDYSFNQIPVVGWGSLAALASLLVHLGLAGLALWRFRQKDVLSFLILYYFITISVVSNIVFINGATLAERFLFMPSVAICVALPVLLLRLFKLAPEKFSLQQGKYAVWIMGAVVSASTVYTIIRNTEWKDNYTLFEAGIKAAPNSARTHASYAYESRVRGLATPDPATRQRLLQQAESAFLESLKIYPEYEYALYNLGVLYYDLGQTDKAREQYLKTLAVTPQHENALINLGVISFQQKDFNNAKQYFEQVIAVNPANGGALGNLGAIYHNQNNFQQALDFYERSLAIDPRNKEVYNNIIRIYQAQGNAAKVQEYEQKRLQYQ
jgi:tetratricopeptide (TPR) repeat protein